MRASHNENKLIALIGTQLRIDADGSVWRIAACPGGGHPVRPVTPRRVDRLGVDGYRRVAGNVGTGQLLVLAHRLVWVALRGPIAPGMEVNHINGVKSDNQIANLDVVTPKENVRHLSIVLGRKDPRGSAHHAAKIDEAVAAQILEAYTRGERPFEISRRLGVSYSSLYQVCRRKSWLHVPAPPGFPGPHRHPLAHVEKPARSA